MSVTGNTGLGNANPFRYRGYYYDSETGLYYLYSRYYDPEVGRFINADDTDALTSDSASVNGKNLYAYCDNNPVVRKDVNGAFWNIAAGAVIGAVVSAAVQVVDNVVSGKKATDGLVTAMVSGAITGGVAATGLCVWRQAAISSAVAGASDFISQVKNGGFSLESIQNVDWKQVGISSAIGFVGGLVGGNGVRHKSSAVSKAQNLYDYTIKGIKNGVWTGSKGGTYLRLAGNNLIKETGRATVVTASKYAVAAAATPVVKHLINIVRKRMAVK